jgi:Uma2 family endonuclease
MATLSAAEAAARPAVDADADEHLEWLRELLYPDRVELLDGEIVVSRAPDPEHQDAGGSLYAWLLTWARTTGEADVWPAPVAVKLAVGERDVEPDVVLLRHDNPHARLVPRQPAGRRPRVRRGYIQGPPDLLVEVISPGHESYDRERKRDLYARCGVPHYWVLDFLSRTAECYADPRDGRYEQVETVPWADLRWPRRPRPPGSAGATPRPSPPPRAKPPRQVPGALVDISYPVGTSVGTRALRGRAQIEKPSPREGEHR